MPERQERAASGGRESKPSLSFSALFNPYCCWCSNNLCHSQTQTTSVLCVIRNNIVLPMSDSCGKLLESKSNKYEKIGLPVSWWCDACVMCTSIIAHGPNLCSIPKCEKDDQHSLRSSCYSPIRTVNRHQKVSIVCMNIPPGCISMHIYDGTPPYGANLWSRMSSKISATSSWHHSQKDNQYRYPYLRTQMRFTEIILIESILVIEHTASFMNLFKM